MFKRILCNVTLDVWSDRVVTRCTLFDRLTYNTKLCRITRACQTQPSDPFICKHWPYHGNFVRVN